MSLLIVDKATKQFTAPGGLFAGEGRRQTAVDEVSFTLERGGKLGVVGESGCGKTTLGRMILGLYRPDGGRVLLDGIDLQSADKSQRRERSRRVQMIWQDSGSALDPRLTIGASITEPLAVHGMVDGVNKSELAGMWLEKVGLDAMLAGRRPHELSGGQRQRVGIARALAVKPDLLIADEPVASLDVSVQTQILQLLADLVNQTGVALVFISHDLRVVRALTERVLVLYHGRAVESGPTASVSNQPKHPYTRALMDAVPALHPDRRQAHEATQEHEPELERSNGCFYAPRCDLAMDVCREQRPIWREIDAGHFIACHSDR